MSRQLPDTSAGVYLMDDLCRVLKMSRSTLERLRARGVFPIPELPKLGRRPRWSVARVHEFIERQERLRTPWRRIA